jgi:hypothetical protein
MTQNVTVGVLCNKFITIELLSTYLGYLDGMSQIHRRGGGGLQNAF